VRVAEESDGSQQQQQLSGHEVILFATPTRRVVLAAARPRVSREREEGEKVPVAVVNLECLVQCAFSARTWPPPLHEVAGRVRNEHCQVLGILGASEPSEVSVRKRFLITTAASPLTCLTD
jgi:hypothetical protein